MESIKNSILNLINTRKSSVEPLEAIETLKIKNKKIFFAAIKELKNEAKIIETKRHKLISLDLCGFVAARIVSCSRSFMFAKSLYGEIEDIHIPIERARGAMFSDVVIINRISKSPKGLSGSIERILKKGTRLITGTAIRSNTGLEILPDQGYRYEIPIKHSQTLGAQNLDKIQVELFETKKSFRIFGKVIKIYGKSSSAKICADAILDKNNIPVKFSPETIKQAKTICFKKIDDKELENRLDLRNENIFTIDGADAKDLDDAVSIEKRGETWLLGVHIADVSHYIRENSCLDKEAYERGTSVYFADRVIPMLPEEISNGICSLNANQDRLTFSALLTIDSNGKLINYDFKKSVINSKVRGVYSEINAILENKASKEILNKYKQIKQEISLAKELSDLLTKIAKNRGNMEIESQESRFFLNEKGICVDIVPRKTGVAEHIIENFMICANNAAALFAEKNSLPFIFRVHEDPDPEKINALQQIASILGFKETRLSNKPKTKDFANLLKKSKGSRYEKLIHTQVLRTMSKAKYSAQSLGHFGLALKGYCHFTSPIRRYPDTSIHRIMSAFLNNPNAEKIKAKYQEFAEKSALNSTSCEIRAMKAERDTEKCYKAEYIREYLGQRFTGKISGITEKGFFVELENTVEGFISDENFVGKNLKMESLVNKIDKNSGEKICIGDTIQIEVLSADVASGEIDFAPIS